MSNADDRIVPFPAQPDPATASLEDPVADALARVGDIPLAEAQTVAHPPRAPNWPAIITFSALSVLSLTAALVSTGPEDDVRWGAAMALVISLLMGGLAVLYRHAPAFWRPIGPPGGAPHRSEGPSNGFAGDLTA